MTALGTSIFDISEELSISTKKVERIKERLGVYSKVQILQLLSLKFNYARIRYITEVDEETIKEIERQAEEKRKKENKESEIKQARKEKREESDRRFRIMIAQGTSSEEIRREFRYSSVGAVFDRKARIKALDRNQIMTLIMEGKSDEEIQGIAKIPIDLINQIRDNYFQKMKKMLNDKMLELNEMVKSIENRKASGEQLKSIRQMIQSLMKRYHIVFTKMDYVFIAYAYTKINDNNRAKGIAKRYLGLEDTSNEGLSDLILKYTETKSITILPVGISTDRTATDLEL